MDESRMIKDKLVRQMQKESNMAKSRMILTSATSACYSNCVPDPGASLSAGQQTCINQCSEKFLAAWNQVSIAVMSRLEKEKGGRPGIESRDSNLSESSW